MTNQSKSGRRKQLPYIGVIGGCLIAASVLAAIKGWHSSTVIDQAAAVAPEYHDTIYQPASADVSLPATPARVAYVPPADLPAIELESLPAMTERLNSMIAQHNAARAQRWNAINQGNLKAAALIECYRSGRGGCE